MIVGDVPPFLKDVFVSPKLAINLAFVGQLVDNNCDIHFFNRGYIV
jgi:CRISPR/Cas system-associated endonuclease Cas1